MSESSKSEATTAVDPAPIETANQTEKQLIQKFLDLKKKVEDATADLKAMTIERDDAEAVLIKALKDDEKSASAKYEGLGHVCIIEGAAHASIQKGRAEDVLKYFKESGRDDMIKESIPASTLSNYVRDCMKMNKELPPGVTFYRPEWITFYPVK